MKRILIILLMLSLSLLTGCWDMAEINQRIFPYSIGIDLNEESQGEKDKYIITVSYPNISVIGEGGNPSEKIFVVSANSSSIFQGSRELTTTLPYTFYYKHLKVLVLGHELAKDEKSVREIIDGINRDFVINKKIKVVTAENTAKELLEAMPNAKKQDVVEGALYNMVQDGKKTSRYTPKSLTDFMMDMDGSNVAITPRVDFKDEDLKVFGGCIYRDYAFIGHLTEEENKSISLIRGDIKADLIDSPFKEVDISYSIINTKVKRRLVDEENIKIIFEIETEGTLREYIHGEEDIKKEVLKEMEETLARAINEEIDHAVDILQNKYKADGLDIANYLKKFHPKLWKRVSENWEELFPKIQIETKVKVNIRRRGLVL